MTKQNCFERWGHLFLAPGHQLRDVYKQRLEDTGMINLEEGLVNEWSSERIVLVGDAIRKLTPNAGWGYNSGVADMVVVQNHLLKLLRSGQPPSSEALTELFERYRSERMEDTRVILALSMRRTRAVAWPGWMEQTIARYIMPWINIGSSNGSFNPGPCTNELQYWTGWRRKICHVIACTISITYLPMLPRNHRKVGCWQSLVRIQCSLDS